MYLIRILNNPWNMDTLLIRTLWMGPKGVCIKGSPTVFKNSKGGWNYIKGASSPCPLHESLNWRRCLPHTCTVVYHNHWYSEYKCRWIVQISGWLTNSVWLYKSWYKACVFLTIALKVVFDPCIQINWWGPCKSNKTGINTKKYIIVKFICPN